MNLSAVYYYLEMNVLLYSVDSNMRDIVFKLTIIADLSTVLRP